MRILPPALEEVQRNLGRKPRQLERTEDGEQLQCAAEPEARQPLMAVSSAWSGL